MKNKKRVFGLTFASVVCALSAAFSVGLLSASATETTTVETPVAEFVMLNGASVRLATQAEINAGAPVNGIRFTACINETYYEGLKADYSDATEITLQSTVSKVVAEDATPPEPFVYEWDITDSTNIGFDKNGVATFYHTINFKALTDEQLAMANAFELQADFWLEVVNDGESEPTKIEADNAGEVDVTRSMRQVAYMAYNTPDTEEDPNPNYKDSRLLKYFSIGENGEAVYDMDVKTKALSTIAPSGVTAEKTYAVDDTGIKDVTGKTLADVFTAEEAAASTTKKLVFFDADNTAYAVETRFVTKIINTVAEATNFFNTNSATKTGYYLLTEDLTVDVDLKYERTFENGTFDGDGNTLTVNMAETYIGGLFGKSYNITVKNLEVNITKDFINCETTTLTETNQKRRSSILGQTADIANFENIQINFYRAAGDTDLNHDVYSDGKTYYLYFFATDEDAVAKNIVVNVANDTFRVANTVTKIVPYGFNQTDSANVYIFNEKTFVGTDYSESKFINWYYCKPYASVAAAFDKYVTFKALTDSNYWTVDTENKTLTFGKVIIVPEEPEEPETGDGESGGTQSDYTPVVRFVVTSDVHIRRYDLMSGVGQLDKFYDSAYAFAGDKELNSGYNKLDGIFVVGDLTNYEVAYEYPLYFDYVNDNTQEGTLARSVMGNHEFSQLVYSGNGNSWANTDTIQAATDKFLAASGYESEDYHAVINGYHFIFVSMDRYGKSSGTQYEYISSTKLDWLKTQLDAAVADDPSGEKPIFVFQHVHPKDTVGSSTNGDAYLKELLDEYPNVVDFSGHTHKPVSDPRSVWQDTFTAINTGSLAYLSQNIRELGVGAKAVNDKGDWASDLEAEHTVRDGGLYYICEIDENNVMRVFVYDIFTDSVFGEPIILDSFGDPSGFDYTSDREDNSVVPTFETTDEITVSKNLFNRTDITFPQATGDDLVENYRIEIYSGGQLFKTEYRLSGAVYGNGMSENMQVTLAGLSPATTYTLKVYAINYWNKVSEPLVKEFTTANAATTTPDIMSVSFNENGGVDALGCSVIKKGTSELVYDEDLEKYVASFDGSGGYKGLNLADWFTTMKVGFSVEAYVKVTATPTASKDPFALVASNDNGGFGLYYTSEGKYSFTCEFGDGETSYVASYAGNINEWVHVVGSFDGTALKLYINGELVATTAISGTYRPPRLLANHIVIGADPYYVNDGLEDYSKASIAVANMYGYSLTAEQVQERYQVR